MKIADALIEWRVEQWKTETEMEGLCEDRFGGSGGGRIRVTDRGKWRRWMETVVKRCQPHPDFRDKEENNNNNNNNNNKYTFVSYRSKSALSIIKKYALLS